ncbi:MAG: D-alanine-D-alanine ligase [Myxococcota bacterium]|jgi:D-alanine-D-alanine ligase
MQSDSETAAIPVAVVIGGESGEHEISLRSGSEVFAAIDRTHFAPFLIRIERDGAWTFPDAPRAEAPQLQLWEGVRELQRRAPAVVFPAMHGPYGEDGRFQSLLELCHLRYVGSGPEASALAMNKARGRDILAAAGLNVAPAQELRGVDELRLKAPCVVKPLRLGSSVGLMVVREQAALEDALRDAFTHDHRVLVEQFVEGTEITGGVLETVSGEPEALPIVEIRPTGSAFFDYHAKYTPGATDEICPAPISDELTRAAQNAALVAHTALDCRGVSRTDFIADATGKLWVLETNTLPGLTQQSLLPKAAKAAGIDFEALVDRLIRRALDS